MIGAKVGFLILKILLPNIFGIHIFIFIKPSIFSHIVIINIQAMSRSILLSIQKLPRYQPIVPKIAHQMVKPAILQKWNCNCVFRCECVLFEVSTYLANHKTIPPVTARQLERDATTQISRTMKKLILSVLRRLVNTSMSFNSK